MSPPFKSLFWTSPTPEYPYIVSVWHALEYRSFKPIACPSSCVAIFCRSITDEPSIVELPHVNPFVLKIVLNYCHIRCLQSNTRSPFAFISQLNCFQAIGIIILDGSDGSRKNIQCMWSTEGVSFDQYTYGLLPADLIGNLLVFCNFNTKSPS